MPFSEIAASTLLASRSKGNSGVCTPTIVNPTKGLEDTAQAKTALADIRGGGHGVGSEATGAAPETDAKGKLDLPVLGVAPDFVDNQRWFNTPGDRPLTLQGLRGRVVLVDFWTYSCINCIRTLPYLKAWDARYRKDGLTIVGVHTPEFPFEREASNVQTAIDENDIRYPVVQDNEQATWNAYGNQYWPAEYFIDAQGRVRYVHFGEGEYGEKEKVIRELLAEAGRPVKGAETRVHAVAPSTTVTTPETYLGAARAERFTNAMLSPGSHDFTAPKALPANEFAYHGKWRISLDSATAGAGASLDLNFGARPSSGRPLSAPRAVGFAVSPPAASAAARPPIPWASSPRMSTSASWAAAVSSRPFEGLTRKLGRSLAIRFWNLMSYSPSIARATTTITAPDAICRPGPRRARGAVSRRPPTISR